MIEFWFVLLAGATIASPVAWAVGRWGWVGFLERLTDWLAADDEFPPIDRHPCTHRSNVKVITPDGAVRR